MEPIILASNSPRRKELLTLGGIPFEVCPANVEEYTTETEPAEVVKALSLQKGSAVRQIHPDKVILAADTVVCIDGKILGKPKDKEDAFNMLKSLNGRTHTVYTGVSILTPAGKTVTFAQGTEVTFYDNSDSDLWDYVQTGEPMDKAGAYGIQGKGVFLVEKICGDYNNVVGLPLARVIREIKGIM